MSSEQPHCAHARLGTYQSVHLPYLRAPIAAVVVVVVVVVKGNGVRVCVRARAAGAAGGSVHVWLPPPQQVALLQLRPGNQQLRNQQLLRLRMALGEAQGSPCAKPSSVLPCTGNRPRVGSNRAVSSGVAAHVGTITKSSARRTISRSAHRLLRYPR